MSVEGMDDNGQIKFQTHWFDEHCRREWDLNFPRFMPGPINAYLELGLGEGHSMRWVLEHLAPARAYACDPYIPKRKNERDHYRRNKENMRANLRQWLEDGTLTVYYEKSYDVLMSGRLHKAEPDGFDLIFVDADHRCLPCLTDCVLCWPLLKMGGIMIMDDYDRRYQRGWPMTREGIDAFLNGSEKRYELLWGEPRKLDVSHVAIQKVRE